MKIIVIGAGASGIMAAIMAARAGADVVLLEKNEKPARKLLVTGNGRCNLTNANMHADFYRGDDTSCVDTILSHFGLTDTISFFTEIGLYTSNQNGRFYPYSSQAQSVAHVLLRELDRLHVTMKTNQNVTGLSREGAGYVVLTKSWQYSCDRVILSAGSAASSVPGSGLSGVTLAQMLGHTVIPFVPALVPLQLVLANRPAWSGVRTDAEVTVCVDGLDVSSARGELQLTDYGVSGIPVFEVSRFASRAIADHASCVLRINFFPDFTSGQLTAYLEKRQNQLSCRSHAELLEGIFAEKLIPILSSDARDLVELSQRITAYAVTVERPLSMQHAQVAAGGVPLPEVESLTMESKLAQHVYLTGELLDVDGTCGGYNLQWAWTTGALAGIASGRS